MANERARLKKAIGGIYSFAAEKIYEPVVVRGTFRLMGGRLNEYVLEQGRRATDLAGGRPILDMPVGTGYFTLEVAKRHTGIVAGSDIAGGMVQQAQGTAQRAGLASFAAVQADAHRLPFADGSFEVVLCSNGLQVIPGLRRTIAELVRVLAPGGRLFISIVNAPVGGILPEKARRVLPTMFRPRRDLHDVLSHAGMGNIQMRFERLAALYEATKPR
jgi:ubiquinone/menaquinone biosynthesis C-methylase UbiE